jgi:hypothetical protein
MPWMEDLDRLKGIASRASKVPAWRPFGRSLELRAQGLRPGSRKAAKAFIDDARCWELDRRAAFVRWLADEVVGLWDERLLIPHDLCVDLVAPTVRDWLSQEPQSSLATYLSGKYCRGDDADPPPLEAFRRSAALDPGFEPARRAFIDWVTAHAEQNQHELPWYGYLGDASEDVRDLVEAQAMLAGIVHPRWRDSMGPEIDALLEAARAWEEYSRSGEPDFADWCRANKGPARFLENL